MTGSAGSGSMSLFQSSHSRMALQIIGSTAYLNVRSQPARPSTGAVMKGGLGSDSRGSTVAPRTAGIGHKRRVQAGQGEPPGWVDKGYSRTGWPLTPCA